MPPRGVRRGGSLGPEPGRGSPAPTSLGPQSKRTLGNPAKHSESYGSPLAARPERTNMRGKVDIDTATRAVFAQVVEEKQKKKEERQKIEAKKAATTGQSAGPVRVEEEWSPDELISDPEDSPGSQPESEYDPSLDDDDWDAKENGGQTGRGSRNDEENDLADQDAFMTYAEDVVPSTNATKEKAKPEPEKAAEQKRSRKRKQEAEEAGDRADMDREARDVRLREERDREAERVATRKRAEVAEAAAAEVEAEARRLVEREKATEGARTEQLRKRAHSKPVQEPSGHSEQPAPGFAAPPLKAPKSMFGSLETQPSSRGTWTPQQATASGIQLGFNRTLQTEDDLMTSRSFREESGIFSAAMLDTPAETPVVETGRNGRVPPLGEFVPNEDDQLEADLLYNDLDLPLFEPVPRPGHDSTMQETGASSFPHLHSITVKKVSATASEQRAPRLRSKQNRSQILEQQDEDQHEPRNRDSFIPASPREKHGGYAKTNRQAPHGGSKGEQHESESSNNNKTPAQQPSSQRGSGNDGGDSYLHRMGRYAENSWLSITLLKRLGYLSLLATTLALVLRLGQGIGYGDGGLDRPATHVRWFGWDQWGYNLGQFIPSVGSLSDDNYADVSARLFDVASKVDGLLKRSDVMESRIKDLKAILPNTIHVRQGKNGDIVIPDEFWHAVRDWIRTDNSLLTLDAGAISDGHWEAVLKRLKASDVDDLLGKSPSRAFDAWLKNNEHQVVRILQDAKLVPEKPSTEWLKDVTLTKESFMREVENNLEKHDKKMEGNLQEVRAKLETLAKQVAQGIASTGSLPAGLSRQEVISLVHDVVRQTISSARLDAAALSNVAAHEETELRRRVNYFSPGNGAVVDAELTSPTWVVPQSGWSSWVPGRRRSAWRPPFQMAAIAALRGWNEPDHCWCAGNGFSDAAVATMRPADLAVQLVTPIVPEVLVLEHIDPSATLGGGGAMPKDVEVWVSIEDVERRERTRDLMAALFPDAINSNGDGSSTQPNQLLSRGFTLVGRFTYAHNARTGGMQVYRLSPELARVGAATDLVLVRAVTNHGADHTCFYRVRLYGNETSAAQWGR